MDFLYQYLNYNELQDLQDKYEQKLLTNLKSDNVINILNYLRVDFEDYIPEIIEDYLDLLTIDYHEFITKFSKIKNNFQGNLEFLEAMYE